MASKEEKLRQQRLQEWYQGNPLEWLDLKEEIKICLRNAEFSLKSASCTNRDFHAGKCQGIEEVLRLEDEYKR